MESVVTHTFTLLYMLSRGRFPLTPSFPSPRTSWFRPMGTPFSHPNLLSGTYETREALSYQRFLLNAQKKVTNIRPSILRSFTGNDVNEQVSF